ncbi:histidine ammonia-lyase [Candidatus Bipolaricaulota bacterium]|nr:histidine ammonia-lyase [Candidatus Bipolaricaulota bacterium]
MSISLDGELSMDDLVDLACEGVEAELSDEVRARVKEGRNTLEELIDETDRPIYGVTTGFGDLVREEIPEEKRRDLQGNLIKSHSAGVGDPLSEETVRAIIALRVNSLGRGNSGIRLSVLEQLVELLNEGVTPYVPEKGSLGASGDLIPLAHVASILIGEGRAYYEGELLPAQKALGRAGIDEIALREKEGLALINGTQAMSAVLALGIPEIRKLVRYADVVGGLTTFILGGNFAQYDSRIYELRPYESQAQVAKNLRKLTEYDPENYCPSNVQDPYSIRCAPQVHGSVRMALSHLSEVVKTEINSVTDNPLIFNNPKAVVSGGNFHGEPLALAADYMKIGLSELASISERRVNRLLHPELNGDLPAYLAEDPGTNSGFMLAQYTSASLVSENKSLASPASVDSIPVSGDQEDHVSMGMHGAKALENIIKNVRKALSVELISACQAQEFAELALTEPLKDIYRLVREDIPPVNEDRELSTLINRGSELLKKGGFLEEISEKYGIS